MRKLDRFLGGVASIGVLAVMSLVAIADEPQLLTEGTVDRLQNTVTVELQQQPARFARVDDILIPKDRLSTGTRALAQIIFNDESLLRVGENSLFQFVPDQRQVLLDEGVMMMVTPAGTGGAEIVTPAAIAGVQGSLATFTSVQQEGDNLLEAATYTSELVLFDLDRQELGRLQPGEVAVVRDGVLESVRQFDRCNALLDNPLLSGLHPDDESIADESEIAAATLRQEQGILEEQGACDPTREVIQGPASTISSDPNCPQKVASYLESIRDFGRGSWQPRGEQIPPGSGRFYTDLTYDLVRGGTIENVQVVRSSGYTPLDQSAIEHVEGLTGFPAFPNCYPADSLEVENRFTLLIRP